jgi:outer membrane protein OmpA-like peptidoglycan-associated protein
MGGYDIFVSEYDSAAKKWSEPVNIGYPINTPDEDIYFVKSGDRKFGYYASVKDGGLGEKDIYKVAIPENLQNYDNLKVRKIEGKPIAKLNTPAEVKPVTLTIQVLDELNSIPIDAMVVVKSSGDDISASISKVSEGVYTCTFNNQMEKEYTIAVEKNGYMFKNVGVTIPAISAQVNQINKNVILSKLQIGFKSILRNIYFDSGKASLKPESYEELNKMERMLRENPEYNIEIAGHTDKIGAADYNKKLSQQRANTVIKFLIDKGIESGRLTAVGYGEEKPLATNDDELEGREINRRTEFEIKGSALQSSHKQR